MMPWTVDARNGSGSLTLLFAEHHSATIGREELGSSGIILRVLSDIVIEASGKSPGCRRELRLETAGGEGWDARERRRRQRRRRRLVTGE